MTAYSLFPSLSNFSDINVVLMSFIVNLLDLSSFETLVFVQVSVISLTMLLHMNCPKIELNLIRSTICIPEAMFSL